MKRLATSIGILSLAVLAHQIFLIQILSFVQWYHFAYTIISVALLGFGTSGTVLSLFRNKLIKHSPLLFFASCSLAAVSIPICYWMTVHIDFDLFAVFRQFNQTFTLLAFYFFTFIPFFFAPLQPTWPIV